MDERKPESGPIFQKPGMEMTARQEQQFPGYSSQPQGPQSTPVPSKWASPADRPGTGQWPEGGVKSIPPLPTKWSPPAGTTTPQERPPPQQGFQRGGNRQGLANRNLPLQEPRRRLGNSSPNRRMPLKVRAAEERWTGTWHWTPFSKPYGRIE